MSETGTASKLRLLPRAEPQASLRSHWLTLTSLFFASIILFGFRLNTPDKWVYDESYYVPAAKQILHEGHDPNTQHPPLGKEILAISIAVFGDNPVGWRLLSVLFGGLVVLGVYLCARAILHDARTALWCALLAMCNNILFVQARVAMLDVFMTAFLVWGLAAFWSALELSLRRPEARNKVVWRLCFSGALLGLATACKWFALFPLLLEVGIILLMKTLRSWRTQFGDARASDWYQPQAWKDVGTLDCALSLVLLPIIFYSLPFIPLLYHTDANWFSAFFKMQLATWQFQQQVMEAHPYMSHWLTWPLILRPMGYAFNREGAQGEWVREVFMIGNPLLLWTGLVALCLCAWGWWRERRRDAFAITVSFASLYFTWALTPRAVGFFYYYFAASLFLGLALAYVFRTYLHNRGRWLFLAACAAVFGFFYPVLSGVLIPTEMFIHWAWFSSWI